MKNIYLVSLIFIFMSCGKQTAPPLVLKDAEKPDESNNLNRAELPEAPKATFSTEAVIEEESKIEAQDFGPSPPIEIEEVESADIKDELKVQPILYEDFAWEKYMVEPGDFLIKIANKEYGDFRLWRYIYEWNKDEIGENPNVIYPYHFFNLQKKRLAAKTTEPTYFQYTVKPGDNLWSIAGKQYGDAKSWIILLWDNEESIKSSAGVLSPGMTLKLRVKLDPNA